MGNACCVSARDKMVGGESLQQRSSNLRHSPSWSFRWDNRGRVAGEETSLSCLSDGKSESAFDGSPLDSFRTHTLLKSPASDLSFPRYSSMDTVLEQNEHESGAPSYPSLAQLSLAMAKQVSDGQTYGRSSATEERMGTPSSHSWSLQAFSEMMSSCRSEETLSYDNEGFGLQRDKVDPRVNRMSNHKQQTCGACSRPLSEKSLWSSQKIFMTNEFAVSAILACGHVYHGQCLEQMTLEVDKFDPSCPLCTLGEKKTAKLSEKAFKVEMELKARHNKRLRNRVLDSEFDCDDFVMFDHSHRAMASAAGKSPKLLSSSSAKSYSSKPFLARHFSFGSRSKSTKENLPVKKKGFFWTKSSKI